MELYIQEEGGGEIDMIMLIYVYVDLHMQIRGITSALHYFLVALQSDLSVLDPFVYIVELYISS